MTIKHISLDFWNTVGKPNPVFAKHRTAYLSSLFGVSEDRAKSTYTTVKRQLDSEAETEGKSYPREFNIELLIAMFAGDPNDNRLVKKIGDDLDELFRRYPPTIDPEITRACMIAHSRGITLSIASNTNFIKGEEISKTMEIPFTFELYSDVLEVSKPHPRFFDEISVHARFYNIDARHQQIVHIGDHHICDGAATGFGMNFCLVENYNTAEVINYILETL